MTGLPDRPGYDERCHPKQARMLRLPVRLSRELNLSIGSAVVSLTPRQGLAFAEDLARKSFRAAMTEEAVKAGVPLDDVTTSRPRATRRPSA